MNTNNNLQIYTEQHTYFNITHKEVFFILLLVITSGCFIFCICHLFSLIFSRVCNDIKYILIAFNGIPEDG